MKLYSVELRTMVVVVGEDEEDARNRARDDKPLIRFETVTAVLGEATLESLPSGWKLAMMIYSNKE